MVNWQHWPNAFCTSVLYMKCFLVHFSETSLSTPPLNRFPFSPVWWFLLLLFLFFFVLPRMQCIAVHLKLLGVVLQDGLLYLPFRNAKDIWDCLVANPESCQSDQEVVKRLDVPVFFVFFSPTPLLCFHPFSWLLKWKKCMWRVLFVWSCLWTTCYCCVLVSLVESVLYKQSLCFANFSGRSDLPFLLVSVHMHMCVCPLLVIVCWQACFDWFCSHMKDMEAETMLQMFEQRVLFFDPAKLTIKSKCL